MGCQDYKYMVIIIIKKKSTLMETYRATPASCITIDHIIMTERIILEMIFITGSHPDWQKYKSRNVTIFFKGHYLLLRCYTRVLLERSLEHHDNPQIYKHCVWKKKKGTAQVHSVR